MKLLKPLLLGLFFVLLCGAGVYLFLPEEFARGGIEIERAISGFERKEIDADGFHMVYLDQGGSGEPLILLHGFGADKDNWTRMARHLKGRYRVIAPDLPGYGESSKPADAHYRIGDQVENVKAFARALALSKFSLGGNSMGGQIAATYAATYPNDLHTLWLLAPAGVWSAPKSELSERLDRGERNPLIAANLEEFDQTLAFVFTTVPFIPTPVRQVLANRAAADAPLRQKQFTEIREESQGLEALVGGLPVPTHITWGDRDRALNVAGADVLKGLIPGSTATIMPGIGHLPMMEVPAATAQDYLKYREALATQRAAAP